MDKKKYIEELRVLGEEVQRLEEKNCPTNPSKWSYYKSQAKQKFDVYPSAYANGWASKQYKAAGGGWKQCAGESVSEGKKRFRQQDGIGKAKYTISYHDGKEKHKDGSDFFGIQIFKNKKDLETFRKSLLSKGYVEESVNEAASRTAMEIGGLTGMNKDAIQKFVDDNKLDIEKVYQYVKNGKLPERMALVSAIAGKPGNTVQTKLIKKFK